MNYINEKIYGLPKLKQIRSSIPIKRKRDLPPYIHKIKNNGKKNFKVHLKRQGKSKIKYFKTLDEAITFVELLKLNPYF